MERITSPGQKSLHEKDRKAQLGNSVNPLPKKTIINKYKIRKLIKDRKSHEKCDTSRNK